MGFLKGNSRRQQMAAIGLGVVGLFGLGTIGNAYIRGTQTHQAPRSAPNTVPDQPKANRKKQSSSRHSKALPALGSVNINTANEQELCELPGVGPTTASQIIQYRSSHGSFQSIDELDNVKGIGPKKLANIRPYCRI